ncbi:MAG: haloacid dehalogenase type II [Gammaproteobacteria bacterium]|nr:haloacid dehalogenase type II [Gammaproteobacteria bacterium]
MLKNPTHSIQSPPRNQPSRRQFLRQLALVPVGLGIGVLPVLSHAADNSVADSVKALTFDVFGTVVDWRGSIIREGQLLAAKKGYNVDWARFADSWRSGYGPAMSKVRSGELPWTKIDDLHRMILDDLVEEYSLTGMSEAELVHFNEAWQRLSPWPDTVSGLNKLKSKYVITTLSNGNVSLLTHMAKNGGLPWDAILSAELSGHYKPDPEAYLKAADLLSLRPEQVMMVAAHPGDLRAAARTGLKTAYVIRPLERGPGRPVNRNPDGEFDYTAEDFNDLARQLGA